MGQLVLVDGNEMVDQEYATEPESMRAKDDISEVVKVGKEASDNQRQAGTCLNTLSKSFEIVKGSRSTTQLTTSARFLLAAWQPPYSSATEEFGRNLSTT